MADFTSKRQRPKKSTYGKAVKSHVSGWFGRNLWAETDSAPKQKPQDRPKSAKQVLSERKEDETRRREDGKRASTIEVVLPEKTESVVAEAALDGVVDGLDRLDLAAKAGEENADDAIVVPDVTAVTLATKPAIEDLKTESKQQSSSEARSTRSTRSKASSRTSTEYISPAKDARSRRSFNGAASPEQKSDLGVLVESPARRNGVRKPTSLSPGKIKANLPPSKPTPSSPETAGKENLTQKRPNMKKAADDEYEDTIVVRLPTAEVAKESERKAEVETPTGRQSSRRREKAYQDALLQRDCMNGTIAEMPASESHSPAKPSEGRPQDEAIATKPGLELSEIDQLLGMCTIPSVVGFTEQIERIMCDSTLKKLGEASYSEVFLQTPNNSNSTTVLKIMPFGKEGDCEVKSIIQEARISQAMADIEGFIGFRGAYVVQGCFPEPLVELWDAYDEEHGSESERPDYYEEDQLFAVIMLENGGQDLEHFDLRSWHEACDVFWQVVYALARGEKEREFEHRDLHWGNIVIRRQPPPKPAKTSSSSYRTSGPSSSDDPSDLLRDLSLSDSPSSPPSSALKVAIIDYTLSRACCTPIPSSTSSPSPLGSQIEYAPLGDPAFFSGKGDYQFDIYRFMRTHLSSGLADADEEGIDWNVFRPRTNVFWLHYVSNALLCRKRLPRPSVRGRGRNGGKGEKVELPAIERECFQMLEKVSKTIDPRKKRFGAKGRTVESARELVEWAIEEGLSMESV